MQKEKKMYIFPENCLGMYNVNYVNLINETCCFYGAVGAKFLAFRKKKRYYFKCYFYKLTYR